MVENLTREFEKLMAAEGGLAAGGFDEHDDAAAKEDVRLLEEQIAKTKEVLHQKKRKLEELEDLS